MKPLVNWSALGIGIAATIRLTYYLFVDWVWQPTEFPWAFVFRIALSGFFVAALVGVEIIFFHWFLTR